MFKQLLKDIGFSSRETISSEVKVAVIEPTTENKSELSETAQVILDTYPAEVIEIHNKFNNEAELLLKEAIEASSRIVIEPTIKNKANLASKFGFNSVREVEQVSSLEREKYKHELVLKAITQAKEYISDYKWIPESSVERICKQYGLVFGRSNQYKGFLPNKNLLDIEKFADKHKSKLFGVRKSGVWGIKDTIQFYSTEKEAANNITRSHISYSSSYNSLDSLMICAPLKDMNTDGYTIEKGYKLEKKAIPDPIVLARRDFNGIEGYYIVTAWGDEASDPEVINN